METEKKNQKIIERLNFFLLKNALDKSNWYMFNFLASKDILKKSGILLGIN